MLSTQQPKQYTPLPVTSLKDYKLKTQKNKQNFTHKILKEISLQHQLSNKLKKTQQLKQTLTLFQNQPRKNPKAKYHHTTEKTSIQTKKKRQKHKIHQKKKHRKTSKHKYSSNNSNSDDSESSSTELSSN